MPDSAKAKSANESRSDLAIIEQRGPPRCRRHRNPISPAPARSMNSIATSIRSAWRRAGTNRRRLCGRRRARPSCRLINTALAERRSLILFNPAEGNSYGTVRTLVAAYQMIMPGEWARVHRHTPNALRLILDAEPGTYTEVDGLNIAMEPGDVLLTPNWSTHGHGNDSKACAYWLDFLDAPLVQLLEPMFFEPLEEEGHEAFETATTTPTTS